MKLTKYSRSKLLASLAHHDVPKEWADVLADYLQHGYAPGSFFICLLSNDAMAMIATSHPSNSIIALKTVVTWLNSQPYPGTFHGSREAVNSWLKKTARQRRAHLEKCNLVYPEKEEILMVLREDPVLEPAFAPEF